jgi:hypothetical protein
MAIPLVSLDAKQSTLSLDELQGQVSRISHSRVFEHSQTLQRLLRYLTAKSIEAPGEQIKEYTIGVEALERRPSFDPKEDTIVRVQIHRLREKLLEYYQGEGIQDPIMVTIPKGRYLPSFEVRPPSLPLSPSLVTLSQGAGAITDETSPATPVNMDLPADDAPSRGELGGAGLRWFGGKVPLWAGAACLAALLFLAGWLVKSRADSRGNGSEMSSQLRSGTSRTDLAQKLWAGLLGNDSAPVIVFADAVYLLDKSNDLFFYPQGATDNRGASVDSELARRYASSPALVEKAGSVYYESGYTGTGDLKAAAELVGYLTRMGATPTVKSSRNLTSEDLKEHCVIVLGSPLQNIASAQLVPSDGFIFDSPSSRHEAWGARLVNLHPGPAEASVYETERDPVTHVLRADYSLISIQPGIVQGRYIAILGGLDTTGTEGAARFATSQAGIESIVSRSAAVSEEIRKGHVPIFQALIRVNLAKGSEVLNSSLVTVHPVNGKSAEPAPNERGVLASSGALSK